MTDLGPYGTGPYDNEALDNPEPINFISNGNAALVYSSANFYKTMAMPQLLITAPLGIDVSPGTVWVSGPVYLPVGAFNNTHPVDEVIYPDANSVSILQDSLFIHDIFIQFKLTQVDTTNYTNFRELRIALVHADGITWWDPSIYGQCQPAPGDHDILVIKGGIQHSIGDVVQLALQVYQDNTRGGTSPTLITILRLTWNITSITKYS